jgi:cytoskeletal protein CcmA (bactofilin family)
MFGPRKTSTTVVARDAHFEGSLELSGSAHVEGAFKGTLKAQGELSVGPEGLVEGTLVADSMIIAGRVDGTVVVRQSLRILKSGCVAGRIYYGALEVSAGGTLSGEVQQGAPRELAEADDSEDETSGTRELAPRVALVNEAAHASGGT